MILASAGGLMCAVTIIRETDKAWIIQYHGEKKKESRVLKSSGRKMFENVDDALAWIKPEWMEECAS